MTVTLLALPLDVIDRLADGDLAAAGALVGGPFPPDHVDGQWVWANFARLSRERPDDAWWFTRYAVVEDGRIVGHCGLHAPPDERGEVHVGWHVDVIHRGRGVGRAAAREIAAVARSGGAGTAVALIAPDNVASMRVAEAAGFVADGDQRHRFGWLMRRYVRDLCL